MCIFVKTKGDVMRYFAFYAKILDKIEFKCYHKVSKKVATPPKNIIIKWAVIEQPIFH